MPYYPSYGLRKDFLSETVTPPTAKATAAKSARKHRRPRSLNSDGIPQLHGKTNSRSGHGKPDGERKPRPGGAHPPSSGCPADVNRRGRMREKANGNQYVHFLHMLASVGLFRRRNASNRKTSLVDVPDFSITPPVFRRSHRRCFLSPADNLGNDSCLLPGRAMELLGRVN